MRKISAFLLLVLYVTHLSNSFGADADSESKLKTIAKDGTTAGAIGMTSWGAGK